jgi:hypothetical protein
MEMQRLRELEFRKRNIETMQLRAAERTQKQKARKRPGVKVKKSQEDFLLHIPVPNNLGKLDAFDNLEFNKGRSIENIQNMVGAYTKGNQSPAFSRATLPPQRDSINGISIHWSLKDRQRKHT